MHVEKIQPAHQHTNTVTLLHELGCENPRDTFATVISKLPNSTKFILPHAPLRRNPKIWKDYAKRCSWFNYLSNSNDKYDEINMSHPSQIKKQLFDIIEGGSMLVPHSRIGIIGYSQGASLAINVVEHYEKKNMCFHFLHVARSIPLSPLDHNFKTPTLVTLGTHDDVFDIQFAKNCYRNTNFQVDIMNMNHYEEYSCENKCLMNFYESSTTSDS